MSCCSKRPLSAGSPLEGSWTVRKSEIRAAVRRTDPLTHHHQPTGPFWPTSGPHRPIGLPTHQPTTGPSPAQARIRHAFKRCVPAKIITLRDLKNSELVKNNNTLLRDTTLHFLNIHSHTFSLLDSSQSTSCTDILCISLDHRHDASSLKALAQETHRSTFITHGSGASVTVDGPATQWEGAQPSCTIKRSTRMSTVEEVTAAVRQVAPREGRIVMLTEHADEMGDQAGLRPQATESQIQPGGNTSGCQQADGQLQRYGSHDVLRLGVQNVKLLE